MEKPRKNSKDFWKDLEKKPTLLSPEAYQKSLAKRLSATTKLQRRLSLVPVEEHPDTKFNQSIQDLWEREKLENTAGRIKEANVEYLKNLKITVRNQTRKELRKAVLDIQEQFQIEVFTMKKEHNSMKEEITSKTREIYGYGQYNIEQNNIIFCNNMHDPIPVNITQDTTKDDTNDLKSAIDFYIVQLNAIKEVAAEYGREAEMAIRKVKEVDLEIQKIKSAHELSMQMLRQAIGSEEEVVLSEKRQIQEEFDSFRNKISQELEIRNLLDQRQREFISSLQGEIKDAKMILQNPRMRIRVHEKLKEAADAQNNILPSIASVEKHPEIRTQSAGKAAVRAEGRRIDLQRSSVYSQGTTRTAAYTANHGRKSSFLFK